MIITHASAPVSSETFLRRAMLADAVLSGTTGLLMIAGAGILSEFLAIPQPLLFWAGLILVPYVAYCLRRYSHRYSARRRVACHRG